MKKVVFLVLVLAILLLANNRVKACEVTAYDDNVVGEAFKYGDIGNVGDFQTAGRNSQETLNRQETWVKQFVEIFNPLIKEKHLEIAVSKHYIDNVGGFTYIDGNKYYIVITQKNVCKSRIFVTVAHEIAHVLQRGNKISLDSYMNTVYDDVNIETGDWNSSPTEEFAEDFAQYFLRKQHHLGDVEKLTDREYDDRFEGFVEEKLLNGKVFAEYVDTQEVVGMVYYEN